MTKFQFIPTGFPDVDRALGGGLPLGGVVLIGSVPGAGKTTLLLQACTAAAQAQHRAIFFGTDMYGADLQALGARVGAPADLKIYGGGGALGRGESMIKSMIKLADDEGAKLLIIDPLPVQEQTEEETVAEVREICDWAHRRGTCAVLTAPLDRNDDLKVPVEVEHWVDAVAVMGYPQGDVEIDDPAVRLLEVGKNRRGPGDQPVRLKMTERGFVDFNPRVGRDSIQ